uniref:Apple domain-containing protein n=1 Tax=Ascaris lumbricoides TaxID=6252 RepID=A0A0M3IAG3_ASCLU
IFLGRCFVNGPGASIGGADYRRDYEISLKDCAITCREDHCCMAFEWTSDGTCTLKSRSLNGTIVNANGVHFGLCLDTGELPHLLISKQLSLISKQVKETVYENQPNICVQPIPSVNHQMTFSAKKENDSDRDRFWDHEVFGPETGSITAIDRDECAEFCSTRPETQMYSWRTSNPRNMDELIGDCTCIKELNRMQLNFGSFSGVVI